MVEASLPQLTDLLLPPMLRPGDTVAAISLSWGGPAIFPHRYAAGVAQLERTFGVRVVPTAHALREPDGLGRGQRW